MAAKTRSRHAQGLVEYALGVALLAVVCVTVLLLAGKSVSNTFSNVVSTFAPAASSPASACSQHSQNPDHCQH